VSCCDISRDWSREWRASAQPFSTTCSLVRRRGITSQKEHPSRKKQEISLSFAIFAFTCKRFNYEFIFLPSLNFNGFGSKSDEEDPDRDLNPTNLRLDFDIIIISVLHTILKLKNNELMEKVKSFVSSQFLVSFIPK
jgi:hypothetical protein